MRKYLFLIYLIFLLAKNSQAQLAIDTINLPEVRLIENKISTYNIGVNIDTINLTSLHESSALELASIINNYSSFYVKKYGALATPTFRGTSSSHTLVLWNGIPINSIANGLSDLSNIYCDNFSKIYIVNGGESSVFGSGAIGGSIHLNTDAKFDEENKLVFNSTIGSYGLSSQSLNLLINHNNFKTKINFHELTNENNFEYVNITQLGNPLSINEYGKIKFNSQHLDMTYQFSTNTKYSLNYWASNQEREVPQNMTAFFSDAKQYDKSIRILSSVKHKNNNLIILAKQAYIQEDFEYTELSKNIKSFYLAESHISDVDLKFFKNNYLYNVDVLLTNNQLSNNNYVDTKQNEKNLAAYFSAQYRSEKLLLNSVLRKEWHSNFNIPFIPTLAFESNLNNLIIFKARINRNFRVPTFNDRYWAGTGANGNINLKPEDALNREIGLELNIKSLKISITGYNLNILDMILWQQIENGSWLPNNIQKVFSRGIETKMLFKFKELSFDGNYAYTISTNESATNALDNSIGKQLRYVPLHKANARFTVKNEKIIFSINTSYNGEVITSYGEPYNQKLDSYILTNISLKYLFDLLPFSLEAKVKNLMNKSYITYLNYPNPGREYLLTLNYTIY